MAHPNAERYQSMFTPGSTPDPEVLRDFLAPDVRWHEAGSTETMVGPDAVVARMAGMGVGSTAEVSLDAVLADDDHLIVVGHARMHRDDQEVSYRYVEYYTMQDGKVTERWSFMDAVPADVAAFFGG
jgi:ketosteroid isomerase-like protein